MTPLHVAAQAILDRWDSPVWEWAQLGPTAELIADLRDALTKEQKVCTSPEHVQKDGECICDPAAIRACFEADDDFQAGVV